MPGRGDMDGGRSAAGGAGVRHPRLLLLLLQDGQPTKLFGQAPARLQEFGLRLSA